jgi:hypothetical protein
MTVYGMIESAKAGDRIVFKFTAAPPVTSGESASIIDLLNQTAVQGWEIVGTGDFNRDGDDEILLIHRGPFRSA